MQLINSHDLMPSDAEIRTGVDGAQLLGGGKMQWPWCTRQRRPEARQGDKQMKSSRQISTMVF